MYRLYSAAFLLALIWIGGKRTTVKATPRGELARIGFEERQLDELKAGTTIDFHPNDAEFGENPTIPLKFKDGRALFPCAVAQPCKAVEGLSTSPAMNAPSVRVPPRGWPEAWLRQSYLAVPSPGESL